MGSWTIHLRALYELIIGKKTGFSVTSKQAIEGNYINLVIPHIIYVLLVAFGISYARIQYGVTASVITNSSWALLNCAIFTPFVYAALPKTKKVEKGVRVPQVRIIEQQA